MITASRFALSFLLLAFAALGLVACADDLPCPEILQVARQPLGADGDLCKQAADCMPTEKLCGVSACVKGVCEVVSVAKGEACASGVGLCDGAGECQDVKGVCKDWDGPAINLCDADSECDDGSLCTTDTCQAGWCAHDPLADGQKCGYALSCKQGLCCVPD